ncbi:MAG: L,D-transpeptidase family protein [Longimicrobiales bacterium]|nr:L,D-transpeptidase family protein [Longimicrobiales bacterium]
MEFAAFFEKYPGYRADSASVVDFYRRRAMQFAWIVSDSLSASAEAFVDLAGVANTGDSQATAEGPSLSELYEEGSEGGLLPPLCDSCATDLELRLTVEFFRFADRRYGGYLSRDLRELNWFIPRRKKDYSRLLDSLAVGKMDLSAYEPIHPQYQLLKASIRRNRELADEPWPALELPGKLRKLEAGDTADVIGSIRHRLHLLGDLEEDGTSPAYDNSLVLAVQRFQMRHGLQSDGVIGLAFLRALNVPLAQRLRTMLVNMERLRWVPEQQPPDLLVVNIPEFRLHVYERGREVMSMDVVVGASATRTVIFSDTLSEIVFSPTWTVPESITRNEILSKMSRDPAYLRKNNMEIIGGSASLPVIRQRPGAGNALGRVKFLFPNSYNIYMHDTPSQGAFALEHRAHSHGCIRLSRPQELAEYLLRDDPDWTPERIREAMYSGRETPVQLNVKRPVMIGYFTAWVDGEGRLNFRDDVYGRDERLARELFISPDSAEGVSR